MAKLRISLTVDEELADEIEQYFRKELAQALKENKKKLPKLANTYEEVLVHGWKTFGKK